MRECAKQTCAEDKHTCAKSERSFEASGAGARSGIPRWSGNARMRELLEGRAGFAKATPRQGGTGGTAGTQGTALLSFASGVYMWCVSNCRLPTATANFPYRPSSPSRRGPGVVTKIQQLVFKKCQKTILRGKVTDSWSQVRLRGY